MTGVLTVIQEARARRARALRERAEALEPETLTTDELLNAFLATSTSGTLTGREERAIRAQTHTRIRAELVRRLGTKQRKTTRRLTQRRDVSC